MSALRVSRVTPFLTDLGGGKNFLFVKVETDGGPHGWGECYTQTDRDRSIDLDEAALARFPARASTARTLPTPTPASETV
jgi:L-alanine-DL-glutamate epimerase-like enolase superfamily enzyme